jgi:hypothetical protein
MSLLGREQSPCKGKERGMDQSSCVRRLFSSGRKAVCKVRKHLRIVLVGGKTFDRSEYHILASCRKAVRKRLR